MTTHLLSYFSKLKKVASPGGANGSITQRDIWQW